MSGPGATPRRAVYRALVGGYELLREEEVARDSAIPFICFTDDPALTSETWQVVHVEPRFAHDATRSARALKILGHPALDEFDELLWVDNTVALTTAPDELFDQWLVGDTEVAAPLHSYRHSVLAEAEVVIDLGLDDFSRVYEQLAHYVASDPEAVEENPHWTGMLARRNDAGTARAMQAWWEHVLRYSRRDQLSFVPVMRAQGTRLRSVPLESHGSPWHEWPRAVGRDPQRLGNGLRDVLRPPAARVGRLQQELDDTVRSLTTAVSHREEVIAGLEAEVVAVRELADGRLAELDTVRHERNLAAAELGSVRAEAEKLVQDLTRALDRRKEKIAHLRARVRHLQAGRRQAGTSGPLR